MKWEPLDFSGIKTVPLKDRPSKVSVKDFAKKWSSGASFVEFIKTLPRILAGEEFLLSIELVSKAVLEAKTVLVGMGAHVIKVGLTPFLVQAMEKNIITGFAVNGAVMIHDVEIALSGKTSEDVESHIRDGSFGAVDDTARFILGALKDAYSKSTDEGLGSIIGRRIVEEGLPFSDYSLLGSAYRLRKPVTVHVALGTDIIHIHPFMDGALMGDASYRDFKIFCRLVSTLSEGVYINIGSAVILPEVFLKAISVTRNLGYKLENITTINMDFQRQYRPLKNVVERPTKPAGRGFNFIGHHEIMVPLFLSALIECVEARRGGEDGFKDKN